jgi:hypothetical protein
VLTCTPHSSITTTATPPPTLHGCIVSRAGIHCTPMKRDTPGHQETCLDTKTCLDTPGHQENETCLTTSREVRRRESYHGFKHVKHKCARMYKAKNAWRHSSKGQDEREASCYMTPIHLCAARDHPEQRSSHGAVFNRQELCGIVRISNTVRIRS